MSKAPAQMLLLEPAEELRFYPPFNNKTQCTLEVTNPTPYSIFYKMKTTATNRYCVKPKMGLLLPYSQEEIILKLKAPRGETEDKFKLLAFVSQNTGDSISSIWEKFDESEAMTSKLTAVFVDDKKILNSSSRRLRDSQQMASFSSETDQVKANGVLKLVAFTLVAFGAAVLAYYK